ncbi:MAG TPA: glycosyltransferase family 4 protein [Syntrophorhabdaceae bacterium]|nr:glycosyltransferase family 4 protein [Syntrophorhabdaceae bacterium]
MKILHLFSDWKWTGPAEPVLSLCKALENLGVDVILAYRKTPIDFNERTVEKEIRQRGVKSFGGLRLNRYFSLKDWVFDARFLSRYVEEQGIDIVHANLSHDHCIATASLSFSGKRPLIIRTDHKWNGMPANWFMSWILSRTDGIVTYSEKIRNQDVQTFRYPAERTCLLPPGIKPYDGPIKDMRHEFGLNGDEKIIGVIGRLKPDRGFDIILKAFKMVKERVDNTRLLIMGRSSQIEESVMKPLRNLGLERDVILAGYRIDDYFSVISLFDVFVMMRAGSDGSARALREVMSMGIPAVVSDVGMLSEMVEDGATGLVASWNEFDLAAKMEALIIDDAKRTAYGANAREAAREKWDYQVQARKMKDFYEHITRLGRKV